MSLHNFKAYPRRPCFFIFCLFSSPSGTVTPDLTLDWTLQNAREDAGHWTLDTECRTLDAGH